MRLRVCYLLVYIPQNVLFHEADAHHSAGEGVIQEDKNHHPVYPRQALILRIPSPRGLERCISFNIGLGLTDYTFIIKNPMDLGTASEKLRNDKYRFVE